MIVDEKMYRRMPRELQALFSCLPNPSKDEVLALFPSTSPSPLASSREEYEPNNKNNVFGEGMGGGWHSGFGDDGSAARFFYCAKADSTDRNEGLDDLEHRSAGEVTGGRSEGSDGLNSPRAGAGSPSGSKNHHPTVKPTSLMRYLCRLVTPPGGIVLDPFAGSGSTGKGAILEGFNFIGIEMDEEYCEIAKNRVINAIENDMPLFAEVSRVSWRSRPFRMQRK